MPSANGCCMAPFSLYIAAIHLFLRSLYAKFGFANSLHFAPHCDDYSMFTLSCCVHGILSSSSRVRGVHCPLYTTPSGRYPAIGGRSARRRRAVRGRRCWLRAASRRSGYCVHIRRAATHARCHACVAATKTCGGRRFRPSQAGGLYCRSYIIISGWAVTAARAAWDGWAGGDLYLANATTISRLLFSYACLPVPRRAALTYRWRPHHALVCCLSACRLLYLYAYINYRLNVFLSRRRNGVSLSML